MPYKVKKQGDKYVVYKKDTGKRVGATAGNKEALRKYLAALHINAKEGVREDAADDIQDLIKKVSNYDQFVTQLGDLAQDPKVQAFLRSGKADGDQTDDKFMATAKVIPVKNLRPTQNEIDVDGSLKWPLTNPPTTKTCLQKEPITIKAPVVTYNGQYIIDGHHRWSQVYAMNKEGQLNCIDLTGPKLKPIDVLKVVQLAIAADIGKVPTATVKGRNLLKVDGNTISKYVTTTITEECLKIVNTMRGATLGKLDANKVAGKIVVPNVMQMQKTSQPISGAPKRDVMPQTDDATNLMQYLTKGVVNFNEPYVMEQKLRKLIRKVVLQEIKGSQTK